MLARSEAAESVAAGKKTEFTLDALGSGSDFTPFLQHVGIATLNFGFGGEEQYGVYHSNYDTYAHYVRFEDPDFQYSLANVQLGGRMLLRLANAEVLPFRFESLARTVAGYAKEVAKLADDMRLQTEFKNQQIREGALKIAADARRTFVMPAPQTPVPFLNFSPLDNAVAHLQSSVAA